MQPRIRRPRLTALLAAGLVLLSASASAAAPPSRESVEELMRVMRLERTLTDINSVMGMMAGHQVELGEEATGMDQKVQALLREELSWNKVKDLYLNLFLETYTQEEVDGQLAFYRSPIGQATLDKQPVLMEKAGVAMQERVGELIMKLARLSEKDEAEGSDAAAQKRTVADIRNVGTAMFSWLTDQVAASAASDVNNAVSLDDYLPIRREKLESILVPQYITSIPEEDGWGNPYEYFLNVADPLAPKVMAIRSAGRDGRISGRTYSVSAFDPESYDEDVLWADGFFVRWPQRPPAQKSK